MIYTSKLSDNIIYNSLLNNRVQYFDSFKEGDWKDWIYQRLMGQDVLSVPGGPSSSDIPCAVFDSLYRRVNKDSQDNILEAVYGLIHSMSETTSDQWAGNSGKWLLMLASSIEAFEGSSIRDVCRMVQGQLYVSLGSQDEGSKFDTSDVHCFLLMFLSDVDPSAVTRTLDTGLKRFWMEETARNPILYGTTAFMGLAKADFVDALELIPMMVSARGNTKASDSDDEIVSTCHVVLYDQTAASISNALGELEFMNIPKSLKARLVSEMEQSLHVTNNSA